MILRFIQSLPEGYSTGVFRGRRYRVTRATYNEGRSFKVYAQELGGTGRVSFNYYLTERSEHLKP